MEAFAAVLASAFPAEMLAPVLAVMAEHDVHAQVVASMFVVGGYSVLPRCGEGYPKAPLPAGMRQAFLAAAVPWTSTSHGISRVIAQLFVFDLLPAEGEERNAAGEADEASSATLRHLRKFLTDNKDCHRMRTRQVNFFAHFVPQRSCTVEGLLASPRSEFGEVSPKSLVALLEVAMREVFLELRAEEDAWKQLPPPPPPPAVVEEDAAAAAAAAAEEAAPEDIQRKIVPWDTLQLGIDSANNAKRENAAGRFRHDVLVAASLVDKTPNQAGLVRTCEVFAAQATVLPSLKNVKTDLFARIAVSADTWQPIEEVAPSELLGWCRARKADGYTIVALEQATGSVQITDYDWPRRVVLLLGAESTGVPAELLSIVDVCVEIPQLGVVRSLNVHVSGAIALWEYTKDRLKNDGKTLAGGVGDAR